VGILELGGTGPGYETSGQPGQPGVLAIFENTGV
jgi:hypothetical protein